MKMFFTLLSLVTGLSILGSSATAQSAWPKTTSLADGSTLKMYEWQTESYQGSELKARAAISVTERGKQDPRFGVIWFKARLEGTGSNKQVSGIQIESIKLPGDDIQDKTTDVRQALEQQVPQWNIQFDTQELNKAEQLASKENALAESMNNNPPEVLYAAQPSILVSIDGSPRLQTNTEWGLETVINSPFTIIKNKDGRFYLYGGKHWYSASAATGPYSYQQDAPQNLKAIETAITDAYKNNNTDQEKNNYTISSIVVTTRPAELIQTAGEPAFGAVAGTNLLYVRNTDDDIFMDVNSQQYYILLAGRWYHSKTLSGDWQYVAADRLPQDFAKIPETSEKANVLVSVAGTAEAQDAVEDAQLPQTARVDRKNTNVEVIYDGDPEFEDIDGTNMQYAINSPYSVVRYRSLYYAVDNGVWFQSRSARGPWIVAVERPYEIALIPPRYPVYHLKYVYIYDVYPDYVYMGYTPGYLNNYIYGPTIVYGTGYHYRSWYRNYYYPRPCTWGYNMRYSPWIGWGFGLHVNLGWFNVGIGNSYWSYSRYGWWGPSAYRPNYYYGNYYGGRYYGGGRRGNNVYINNTVVINNNVYNNRRGIVTQNIRRGAENRGGYLANNRNGRNPGNSIQRPDRNNNNRPDIRRNRDIGQGNANNNGNRNRDIRGNRDYRPNNNTTNPSNRNNRDIIGNGRDNNNRNRNIERPRQEQPSVGNPSNRNRGNERRTQPAIENPVRGREAQRPVRQQPPSENRPQTPVRQQPERNRQVTPSNSGGGNGRPVQRNVERRPERSQPPAGNGNNRGNAGDNKRKIKN